MNTLEQIKSELLEKAEAADIEGVAVDSLCSLLAYSIYKNQMLQARLTLENSFSTSSNLNSRIHHSVNMLYSVFRGKCPYISVSNVQTLEKLQVKYLDSAFTYGGFYFYHREASLDYNPGAVINDIEYICCASKIQTSTVSGSQINDNYFYVDFLDENISEDYYIRGSNGTDYTTLSCTSNINEFYIKDTEGNYVYDYLVMTLPSYGLRLMRRADSESWGFTSFELTYLPYSETVPEFDNLRSIPSLIFNYNQETGEKETTLQVYDGQPRLEDLDQIYVRAVDSYYSQNTISTTYDLASMLQDSAPQGSFKVYNDIRFTQQGESYTKVSDPNYTSVIFSNAASLKAQLEQNIEDWRTSLGVTTQIMLYEAKPTGGFAVAVEAYSSSMILTLSMLTELSDEYQSRIGQSLSHSDVEADLVRLGFTYVKTYVQDDEMKWVEWTDAGLDSDGEKGVINCEEWQYPSVPFQIYRSEEE